MGKELERKYLVKGPIPDTFLQEPDFIQQGYFFVEKDKHLRVRITWDTDRVPTANLGLKYTDKILRDEYEPTIPFSDAEEIMERCEWKLEKTRVTSTINSLTASLDTYPDGLQVIEVEFEFEQDYLKFVAPEWFGDEISGVYVYSNITLAKQNLKF